MGFRVDTNRALPGTRNVVTTQRRPATLGTVDDKLGGGVSTQFNLAPNLLDTALGPFQSGQPFTNTSRALSRQVLGSGFSEESAGQANLRENLRNQIMQRLAGLSGDTTQGIIGAENAASRNFAANLSQLRRGLAGTGQSGGIQAGRVAGSLASENQVNLIDQINRIRQQELQNALGLVGAGGSLGEQELQGRAARLNQARLLSDLLNQQAQSEIGRDLGFAQFGGGGSSDLERALAGLLGAGATVGGAALGRP